MSHRALRWGRALCGGLLCGLLCANAHSEAHAQTPPHLALSATPAWSGWSRPGRASEIDLRVGSDTATRATLVLTAGRQTLRTEVDLQPGRVQRLQLPVPTGSSERVTVSAAAPGATPLQRDVRLALSESPLLAVVLATGAAADVALDGFHALALTSDDLPRQAAAFASIDALVIDAATLAALDERQLGALLGHAAGCGRIVVLRADARLRRVIDAAGGCGKRFLMHADSAAQATAGLTASLADSAPPALPPSTAGDLVPTDTLLWNRVALMLAVYLAAAALAATFFPMTAVSLLLPLLATLAVPLLLHALPAAAQVVVWSEGESGASTARYQAWTRLSGRLRERASLPLAAPLAPGAAACDTGQAVDWDIDAASGLATRAAFPSRLFGQTALCFEGSFPMTRALAVQARGDSAPIVTNVGGTAWPDGTLLVGGGEQPLPALAARASATLAPPADATATAVATGHAAPRLARARTPADTPAALWPLDLSGAADLPLSAAGWLLVAAPRR